MITNLVVAVWLVTKNTDFYDDHLKIPLYKTKWDLEVYIFVTTPSDSYDQGNLIITVLS